MEGEAAETLTVDRVLDRGSNRNGLADGTAATKRGGERVVGGLWGIAVAINEGQRVRDWPTLGIQYKIKGLLRNHGIRRGMFLCKMKDAMVHDAE